MRTNFASVTHPKTAMLPYYYQLIRDMLPAYQTFYSQLFVSIRKIAEALRDR
jgi:hypothetical protein